MTCTCNTGFTALVMQKVVCYYCGVPTSKLKFDVTKQDEAPAPSADPFAIEDVKACETCTLTPCACLEVAWAKYTVGYGWDPSKNRDGCEPRDLYALPELKELYDTYPVGKPKFGANQCLKHHTKM